MTALTVTTHHVVINQEIIGNRDLHSWCIIRGNHRRRVEQKTDVEGEEEVEWSDRVKEEVTSDM